MANTVDNQVLSVDTGKAISSLKEFKARIDELKGVLLGAKEGTEEWSRASKELRERQEKLNEVMDIAKGRNKEAEDSYYALNKRLVELRKAYKSLSEENRTGVVGAKMLEGIQELDTKLKSMDADMGQYFRNVGNYSGAFTEAFDKALAPLGKVNGVFGTLARDVKGMIPLIKNLNTTATTGLKGIKAAIASTGIGLLVIAVGELAAHWEDVYKWLTGVNSITKDLDETTEKMVKSVDVATKNIGYQLQIRRAQGQTEVQLLEFQQKELSMSWAKLKVYRDTLQTKLDEVKAHSIITKLSQGEYILIDELEKHIKETDEKMASLKEEIVGVAVSLKAAQIKERADELKDMAAKSKDAAKEFKKLKEEAKKFIDTLNNENDSDLTKIRKNYTDRLATLEGYYKAGLIKEDEYQRARGQIEDQYRAERSAKLDADLAAIKDKSVKAAKDTADKTLKEIEQTLKESELELKIKYSTPTEKKESGGFLQNIRDFLSDESIIEETERKLNQVNEKFQIAKDASLGRISTYEQELKTLEENGLKNSEVYLETENALTNEKLNLKALETQNVIDNNEIQNESDEKLLNARVERLNTLSTAISSISSLMGGLSSMMESQIQQEVKDGKISEAQAKKKFKQVKALNYTTAVLNTAAGVITAIATAQKLGPPMGPIVGAINGAAVAAAGAIQIATIAKQKFDSNASMNNSITTPNMTNITNEYQPQYVANTTGDSELSTLANALNSQPIYVRVSDIEAGTKNSNARVVETTF